MIDIHCHILPNFDDGASSLEESLAMARLAVESGVSGIVATPHFRGSPESLASLPKLMEACQQLQRHIRRENIGLSLLPGAEILCLPQTGELAESRSLPTLGNTRYLLVEFFFDESATRISQYLRRLTDCGYKCVIAHPERYEAVQHDPGLLEAWFRQGYVIQLNKGSVLGAFGPRPARTAKIALHHGFAHLIASDAHSALRRTTSMHRLRQQLQEMCPEDYVRILLEKNPSRLIRDMDMEPTA